MPTLTISDKDKITLARLATITTDINSGICEFSSSPPFTSWRENALNWLIAASDEITVELRAIRDRNV